MKYFSFSLEENTKNLEFCVYLTSNESLPNKFLFDTFYRNSTKGSLNFNGFSDEVIEVVNTFGATIAYFDKIDDDIWINRKYSRDYRLDYLL